MKRAIFLMVAIIVSLICAWEPALATASGVITDERYDYEYLITEILFKEDNKGTIYVSRNNSIYGNSMLTMHVYRLSEEVSPYEIVGVPSLGRSDVYVAANIPTFANTQTPLSVNKGLSMGEDEDMGFYFTISVAMGTEFPITNRLIGTRKVSYASCVQATDYAIGTVCRLREEIDGVFYYDAYLNGALVELETSDGKSSGSVSANEEANEDKGGDYIDNTERIQNEQGGISSEEATVSFNEDHVFSVVNNTEKEVDAEDSGAIMSGQEYVGDDEAKEDTSEEDWKVPETGGKIEKKNLDWWALIPLGVLGLLWIFVLFSKRRREEDDSK